MRQLSVDRHLKDGVVDELIGHLQDRYDEHRSAGLPDEEAINATLNEVDESDLRDTGACTRHPISGRPPNPEPERSGNAITDFWRDARYGARLLVRNPGFTATVVTTLAFGIAANTIAFTLIATLLLKPLPVERESELVIVSTVETANPENADTHLPVSYQNLLDLRERNDVFSGLAGNSTTLTITLTGRSKPERMFAELVTANYFETLGIKPYRGRFFLAEEDRVPGANPVVVLGYAPWQRRFNASPEIVGRTIEINSLAYTVVGVAPEGFKGLDPVFGPDVWIPSAMIEAVATGKDRNALNDRAALRFHAVGRLRQERTIEQAKSNLSAIAAQLAGEYPNVNRDRGISVRSLSRATLLGVSPRLALLGSVALMAVPALVLLIACSNVANLLMARATARRHEIGVRLTLGAGRSRVVRQLLTESTLVGLISGAVGLGAALAGVRVLSSLRPADVSQNLVDVSFDANVMLFAAAVSVLTTVIFGAAPALHASRLSLAAVLNDESRAAGQTIRFVNLRHALLVGQVALSLMALVTAGLFLRSVQRSYAVDPGFERENLGIVLLNPGQAGYDRPRTEQLYRTVRDRLSTIPGVVSVSWATSLPLFTAPSRSLSIPSRTEAPASSGALAVVTVVDLGYFATADIAITRGRDFADYDRDSGLPVAIVNETLASRYWPAGDPIGQRVSFVGDDVVRQVVGVVETVNYDTIGEAPQLCVYLPLAQNFASGAVLYVRTAADPAPVLATVQRQLRQIDDRLDVNDARTARTVIDQALFSTTMSGRLLGAFGTLALALASLGMYGVMSYSVSLRRREMGVRLALGADSRTVLTLVLRDGLKLVAIGLMLGAVGAVGLGAVISRVLYGVSPMDPPSLLGAAAVLLVVAALACYLPARRASRLDPLAVLRTT